MRAGAVAKLCVVDEDYAVKGGETILTADGPFTFDGLPQGRGDISVIGYLRTDRASSSGDDVSHDINDDATDGNYASQRLQGSGSVVAAARQNGATQPRPGLPACTAGRGR